MKLYSEYPSPPPWERAGRGGSGRGLIVLVQIALIVIGLTALALWTPQHTQNYYDYRSGQIDKAEANR